MNARATPAGRYAVLQRVLVVLLAINCVGYIVQDAAREAADSIAWFTLLVLLYIETSAQPRTRHAFIAAGMRYLRIAAAAVIAAAVYAYALAGAWLDATNSALWIAVATLLELQVRYPGFALRRRTILSAVAVLLYGGLSLLALTWLAQREWLAAYDATLWLAAFAIVELEMWSGAMRPEAAVIRTQRGTPR